MKGLEIPAEIAQRLSLLGKEAARQGAALYAVGGCVRDWLLGRATLDIDLAVEGDSGALALAAQRIWGGELEAFDRFGTVSLRLEDGLRLDFARTRAETYVKPAALPAVRPAGVDDDLRRRDFSVNAMALKLTDQGTGGLLDPFGGRADMEAKVLRVLHPGSFGDDPTRIFRAARYAARFVFGLERETDRLLREAVKTGMPGLLSRERIRQELLRTLEEAEPQGAMERLKEWGLFPVIHPDFVWPGQTAKTKDAFARLGLCALAMGESGGPFVRSLKLGRPLSQALLSALERAKERKSPVKSLPALAHEVLAAGLQGLSKNALEPLLIGGEDLKSLGLEPGKDFSRLLSEAAAAQWRGEFETREQALAWVRKKL